ncbi:hypothetical protein FB472_1265 [Rhodoglobus vestalii]|uniref:Uncharacterized protein n=1 Tax=Rhodoglobus vestalii TaxID=193384 RepID=A0A8H2K6D3_9MICO|nr:hypothetical protein FB472_1265 [Rhodoglobus vestalii]
MSVALGVMIAGRPELLRRKIPLTFESIWDTLGAR